MRIAVTGASGQIGTTLVRELVGQGHSVKAMVYNTMKGIEDLPLEFFLGDVLNPDDCINFCKDVDVVFHLAAIVSINGGLNGKVWNVNVNGTRNMLEACVKNKVGKLVHFSSIHAFSTYPFNEPMNENRELAGINSFPYEKSKAAAQKLVVQYVKEYGLNASIINPTGVLGGYDHHPSPNRNMLIDFYNGKVPMLLSGGFNWVDARDVVKTAISAMHQGEAGECYIAGGKYFTLSEFSQVIGRVTGKKTPKIIAPLWALRGMMPLIGLYGKITGTEPLYTAESLKSLVEGNKNIVCDKACRQLGHQVRPIEETLADTYQWLMETGYINQKVA